MANTRAAELEADNQRLRHQLDQLQPQQKRRRIVIDPNERFANIEQIKAAIDRDAAQKAQSVTVVTTVTTTTTIAVTSPTPSFESLCTQWQI